MARRPASPGYLIDHGNDGLIVAGSTGESVTLTTDEKLKLFSVVKEAIGHELHHRWRRQSWHIDTISLIKQASAAILMAF